MVILHTHEHSPNEVLRDNEYHGPFTDEEAAFQYAETLGFVRGPFGTYLKVVTYKDFGLSMATTYEAVVEPLMTPKS